VRIAIVSQFSSPGGGARFLRGLCLGLLGRDEVDEIGLFIDSDAARRDGLLDLLADPMCLDVHLLNSRGDFMDEGVPGPKAALNRLRHWARNQPLLALGYRTVRYRLLGGTTAGTMPRVTLSERVLEQIGRYDVAYFPWPRQVTVPPVPSALVATFHDFNHRHGFGNFQDRDIEMLDAEMVEWLQGRVQPICSTRFIANELDRYCPGRTNPPEITYLSTFAIHDPVAEVVGRTLQDFRLPEEFALCPTSVSQHKNLVSLLKAAGKLKRDGRSLALVLTGTGTQCLGTDPSRDPLYASVFREAIDDLNAVLSRESLVVGEDVWPLGYVADIEIDALTKGAAMVVAPSLYEAGSGPALDAWWLGTPVVTSSLEPVIEQMEFLGTEALLFEPTDVEGLAGCIASVLDDPERAADAARRSQEAIKRYSWDDVAREYARVFGVAIDRAADRKSVGAQQPA
jgi:glycosyltransferase involved in cell wall biosynthesis